MEAGLKNLRKLSILVARDCFMNCRGCYLDERHGVELTLREIVEFAKGLRNEGFEEITLSGGDPLKRADIKEIIFGVKELGFKIHLDTVGLPILNNSDGHFPVREMSRAIDLIGIPYDGSEEEIMLHFRVGVSSLKEKIEGVLKKLNDNDFNISVNTVVHAKNIDNLTGIYQEITKFPKIIRWELHQYAPLSKKAQVQRDFFEVGNKEFLEKIALINNEKGIVISPKPNNRKLNFVYLDFNGDFVELRGGVKKVLYNIKEKNLLKNR